VEVLNLRPAWIAMLSLLAAACTDLRMTAPESGTGGAGGAAGADGSGAAGSGVGGTLGLAGASGGAGGAVAGGGGAGGTSGTTGGGRGGTVGEPARLIAYWRFNEGNGTTVTDSSGNGQTLALSATGATWASGHDGGGLTFDGASGLAGVTPRSGHPLLSYPVSKLTFSAWVKPDATAASRSFATAVARAHEDFAFEDFWLGLADGKPGCTVHNAYWEGAIATAPAPAGAWIHLACTYALSGVVTLYVNGSTAASSSSDQTLGPIPTRILVGAAETDTLQAYFPGVIDDVRIYNQTLTAAEVQYIAAP